MILGSNFTTGAVRAVGLVAALSMLAACDENGEFQLLKPSPEAAAEGEAEAPQAGDSTKLVERDVEAPDVFQSSEAGLWDGRPSLGGVWVAHPDVTEPERVIIRNTANGKFVVGALFRREREIPGPRLQVSSDAANSLSMLAGAPVELSVIALRRETAPEEVPADAAPVDVAEVAAPDEVSETALDPVAVSAAAAIEGAEPSPPAAAAAAPAPAPQPKPAAAPAPRASSLKKPFLQIGIFSVEANADRTAQRMRSAGMVPTVKRGESNGKPFWRVVIGPAGNSAERATLLKKIKAEGFTDAYAVTN